MFAALSALFLLLAPARAEPRLFAVDHTATWQGEQIAWVSVLHLDGEGGGTLPLARPVPGPVEGADTVSDAAGRVVAVQVPEGARSLRLQVVQPAPGQRAAELAPPMPLSDAPQRIDLDGLRWDADPALGLERHMRRTSPPGFTERDRRKVDRWLDGRRQPKGSRIYVIVDASLADSGLKGEVGPARVDVGVALAVGGLFAGVLGAGALGYRHLEGQARRERIDRYLEDEVVRREVDQALGRVPPG